jgi:hypothetical protein
LMMCLKTVTLSMHIRRSGVNGDKSTSFYAAGAAISIGRLKVLVSVSFRRCHLTISL